MWKLKQWKGLRFPSSGGLVSSHCCASKDFGDKQDMKVDCFSKSSEADADSMIWSIRIYTFIFSVHFYYKQVFIHRRKNNYV